jgi:hypothetical protein
LAPTLYVETNFAIGIAKGQDRSARDLLVLSRRRRPVRLVIPIVCFLEILAVRDAKVKLRRKFIDDLTSQIRELRRDETSEHARVTVGHLEDAAAEAGLALADFVNRLDLAIGRLTGTAEMIEILPTTVRHSRRSRYTRVEDPQTKRITEASVDNLILHCILRDAEGTRRRPSAFLSANRRDFGSEDVLEALTKVGVRYFSSCEAAVGWLTSHTGS